MRKFALTLLLVLGVAGVASGEVLLSAGFEQSEGYSDGSLGQDLVTGYLGDAGNQQGWYTESYTNKTGGTANAIVTDTLAHTGTQSLRHDMDTYYYLFYSHIIPEKTTGILTVDQWVYFTHVDATTTTHDTPSHMVLLDDRFDTNGATAGNEYAGMRSGLKSRVSDALGTYRGYKDPDTIGYPHGTWYTLEGIHGEGAWKGWRIVVDIDNATLDLYGDVGAGWVTMATDLEMQDSDTTTVQPVLFDVFRFYQMGPGSNYFYNSTNYAYIDDISITWVPEPVTMGMLALGGLGVLLRRKRR